MAWNRENTADGGAGDSALAWSVTAMADTAGRLASLGVSDPPQAFAVISEAVWWVTIVDATLVRYHVAAYGRALAAQEPVQRRRTEGTFAGLRFVRNRMGYHTAPAEFAGPRPDVAGPPVAAWTWCSLPSPAPDLPPGRRDWEMSRYRAYQEHLAGQPIGGTFQRASAFLIGAAAAVAPG